MIKKATIKMESQVNAGIYFKQRLTGGGRHAELSLGGNDDSRNHMGSISRDNS